MTKKELDNKLKVMYDILLDAKKLSRDSYHMLLSPHDRFTLIQEDKFLTRSRDSFWRLSVVELFKLYGINEDFRLHDLLNAIIKYYDNSELNGILKLEKLKYLRKSLVQANKSIEKLRNARNWHYAHRNSEPKEEIHDIKYYYDDCNELIELAESIVGYIGGTIQPEYYIFDKYEGEDMISFLDSFMKTRLELSLRHMKVKRQNRNE